MTSTSIVFSYRHRLLPVSSPPHRSEFDIRFLPPCILSISFRLVAPSENGAFRNSRGHAGGGGGGEHGDLRNYGRWKTGDLPGDRHLGVHQVYGIALHAWLARRSKETNRFTFVPVATSASVQPTQIILPRVHCLRITRCISSRRFSFTT